MFLTIIFYCYNVYLDFNILNFFLNVYIISKSKINVQLSTYYFCMCMHNITMTPIAKYIKIEEMQ
jgi:hypothetical protein